MKRLKNLVILLLVLLFTSGVVHAESAGTTPAATTGETLGTIVNAVCNPEEFSIRFPGINWEVSLDDALATLGIDFYREMFFCEYESLFKKGKSLTDNFVVGVKDLARDSLQRSLDTVLADLGTSAGLAEKNENIKEGLGEIEGRMNAAIAAFDVDNPEGTFGEMRAAIMDGIDESVRLAADQADPRNINLDDYEVGTPQYNRAKAIKEDPNALMRASMHANALMDLGNHIADVQSTALASTFSAESYLQDVSHEGIIESTVTPETGTAAIIRKAAAASTSTREAINELTSGFADYMVQDSLLNAHVIEGLHESVRQQMYTNHQLRIEAERRYEKELRAAQAQQAAYYASVESHRTEMQVEAQKFEDALFGLLSPLRTTSEQIGTGE